jgi:hypothetical protein
LSLSCRFLQRNPFQYASLTLDVLHAQSIASTVELQFYWCLIFHEIWTKIAVKERESVPTKFNNVVLCAPSHFFVVMSVILISSVSIVLVSDQEQKDIEEITIILLERHADQTLPCKRLGFPSNWNSSVLGSLVFYFCFVTRIKHKVTYFEGK